MTRTSEELHAVSLDVLYDVQLMFRASDRLGQSTIDPEFALPWEIEMALLESFAVHARCLIHFLWRDGSRHPEDAFARDFFRANDWQRIRPSKERTIDGVDDRVGVEIAHLSYNRSRVPEEDRLWSHGQIVSSIGRCLREFITHVPEDRVVGHFKADAWAAMPAFLRAPVAMSWPPDNWPPTGATSALPTGSRLAEAPEVWGPHPSGSVG
jgi:hypothetical protein